MRTAINPIVYSNLPILIAIDKGYFAAENLDLKVLRYNGSSVTQMPLLARGDLDVALMVAGPAIFNQRAEGFDIRLISSVSETHPGWHDSSWLIVRKDDAQKIRSIADMKGHAVDGGTPGSADNLLMLQALKAAGLTRSDVKYTTRIHPTDGFAAFQNKAIDVLASVEPIVGQMVAQGSAVRLTSSQAIIPWFQESYFAASGDWLNKHPEAAVRFLKAYLRAAKAIVSQGPRWDPEEIEVLSRWTKLPKDIITNLPSPPYYGQLGTMRTDSLAKQQEVWIAEGLVQNKIDPAALIDSRYIDEARKEMEIR